jgi:hypothetical protein
VGQRGKTGMPAARRTIGGRAEPLAKRLELLGRREEPRERRQIRQAPPRAA